MPQEISKPGEAVVLLRDHLLDTRTAVSPRRDSRPDGHTQNGCPFCPDMTHTRNVIKRIPDDPDVPWRIALIQNEFYVFRTEGKTRHAEHVASGIHTLDDVCGFHELIIPTPCHTATPSTLGAATWSEALKLIVGRQSEMYAVTRDGVHIVHHINVYMNHGKKAGASQPHLHIHILGSPVDSMRGILGRCLSFLDDHNISIAEYDIAFARRHDLTVIDEPGAHFVALCPLAPRQPSTIRIFPTVPATGFHQVSDYLDELGVVMDQCLRRLTSIHGEEQDLNILFYEQSYLKTGDEDAFRCWIEILPRRNGIAGNELLTGGTMWACSKPAEHYAKLLRAASI